MTPVHAAPLTEGIIDVASEYGARGIGIAGISSNSVETHPQDGPDAMAKEARELGAQPGWQCRAAPCAGNLACLPPAGFR